MGGREWGGGKANNFINSPDIKNQSMKNAKQGIPKFTKPFSLFLDV